MLREQVRVRVMSTHLARHDGTAKVPP